MKNNYTLPNILSLLRIILTPVFIAMYMQGGGYQVAGVALFTFAMLTDSYDGYYARRYGLQTKLGAFLDPIADKILVLATFSLFVWQGMLHWVIVTLMALRDIVVTGLRLQLVAQGTSLRTSELGKGKTAAQFFSIYLFFIVDLMGIDCGQVAAKGVALLTAQAVILVVVLLSLYSGLDYIIRYWRHTNNNAGNERE
ncbi:MAG: CDP-diacylglycerol--glycerol-3-phosphate 3-phosphatidyltransferase [Candidatus Babeliales bacterium]